MLRMFVLLSYFIEQFDDINLLQYKPKHSLCGIQLHTIYILVHASVIFRMIHFDHIWSVHVSMLPNHRTPVVFKPILDNSLVRL